jgi:purine-nucleoside phosphorylase
MHAETAPVDEVVARLRARFGGAPETALVLGSGLGGLVDAMVVAGRAPYAELGLPGSTVAGHASELVVGELGGHRIATLAGRVHLYEGRSPAEVVRYVRVLHRWGVRRLVITNSVGGITAGMDPGVLVVVTDHVNFQGRNPLYGDAYGTRFPDMSRAYDPELRARLHAAAAAARVPVRDGVLAAMLGPSYETPAEIRMLARLGVDVVGMSTVPEVIAAAEVGLRCAVVSLVSNHAAGISLTPLTHEEVTAAAREAGARFAALLTEAVRGFAQG